MFLFYLGFLFKITLSKWPLKLYFTSGRVTFNEYRSSISNCLIWITKTNHYSGLSLFDLRSVSTNFNLDP